MFYIVRHGKPRRHNLVCYATSEVTVLHWLSKVVYLAALHGFSKDSIIMTLIIKLIIQMIGSANQLPLLKVLESQAQGVEGR